MKMNFKKGDLVEYTSRFDQKETRKGIFERLEGRKAWCFFGGCGTETWIDVGELRLQVHLEVGKFYRTRDGRKVDEAPQSTPTVSDPHIVAVVENGGPAPATRPMVHPSASVALAEARRLAREHPGSKFAVYKRVSAVVAEVTLKEVA